MKTNMRFHVITQEEKMSQSRHAVVPPASKLLMLIMLFLA